jgi:hypothetical protein
MTPEGNVAEVESVPPRIKHGLVEIEDTVESNSCWRRCERGEAIVNRRAFGGDARERCRRVKACARRFIAR